MLVSSSFWCQLFCSLASSASCTASCGFRWALNNGFWLCFGFSFCWNYRRFFGRRLWFRGLLTFACSCSTWLRYLLTTVFNWLMIVFLSLFGLGASSLSFSRLGCRLFRVLSHALSWRRSLNWSSSWAALLGLLGWFLFLNRGCSSRTSSCWSFFKQGLCFFSSLSSLGSFGDFFRFFLNRWLHLLFRIKVNLLFLLFSFFCRYFVLFFSLRNFCDLSCFFRSRNYGLFGLILSFSLDEEVC